MYYNPNINCCGIKEMHNISMYAPEKTILAFKSEMNEISAKTIVGIYDTVPAGVVMFTDANSDGTLSYGKRLADYIIANKLGRIEQLAPFENPNSGNIVTPFFWYVGHPAFKVFLDKHVDKLTVPKNYTNCYRYVLNLRSNNRYGWLTVNPPNQPTV